MKIVSKSNLVSAGVTIGVLAVLKRFAPDLAAKIGV